MRLCRCWLGTVSLTINRGVLQLTHPRKCRGLPGLLSPGEVGDFYIDLDRYICRWLGTVSLTINLVLSHYNPRRYCCLPGSLLMVRGRSFCLHALLGVLLPTPLFTPSFPGSVRRGRREVTTESTPPFFSVMPAAVQCSWSYGLLVHGQSVTLGTDPYCGLGLGWMFFLKGGALVLLRMVVLLRDLHYDHLDRLEGHRTASRQRHGCCATCQIITETVPCMHGWALLPFLCYLASWAVVNLWYRQTAQNWVCQ